MFSIMQVKVGREWTWVKGLDMGVLRVYSYMANVYLSKKSKSLKI